MKNIVHNCDNMDFMKDISDNYYELAIVDPPYGIGNFTQSDRLHKNHKEYSWNNKTPDKEYFIELKRISKNQIIWGANYYNCFDIKGGSIIWDKDNPHPSMSKCEIASHTFYKKFDYVKIIHYGFNNTDNFSIHPCQKPIALYKWLLKNYAKKDDKIFDSHVGSGSIRIACYELGFKFEGCELDIDYYNDQEKRFKEFKEYFDKNKENFNLDNYLKYKNIIKNKNKIKNKKYKILF